MKAFLPSARSSRCVGLLARCATAMLLLIGANAAQAGVASCNGPMPASLAAMTPTGTYTVPRDVPVGTVLTPWTNWQTAPNAWLGCTFRSVNLGPVYRAPVGLPTVTVVNDSPTSTGSHLYALYPTDLPGVGLIAQVSSAASFAFEFDQFKVPLFSNWVSAGPWGQAGVTGTLAADQGFGYGIRLAFVKIGPMASGLATATPGTIADVGMDDRPITSPNYLGAITVSGSATFLVASCTTPDVSVDLGEHQLSSFTGPTTTTPTVDFSVKLNDCPAGMYAIKYRIDPATTVVDATQSVVALDATSTATGTGVQLLDGAGSPHPLGAGTDQLFPAYSPATGGSYTIPLKARYYQTEPNVTAGAANTTLTFTMSYQ